MEKNHWEDKKILITGGTGFAGKNLTSKLDKLGAESFIFGSNEFDLTLKEEADMVMNSGNVKYDYIIHMAALQHAGEWPLTHTGIQFYANNLIHINTLEAWRNYQPQAKFIGIGTSCSFPGDIEILSEEDIDKGPLHSSVYSYGLTKKVLGVGIKAYKDQYKLRGTMPIFTTLYGPHDDFNKETSHVVAALIDRFVKAKESNLEEVEVWGDGNQRRELVYIEDQIDGLLMAAENYEGNIINIGTGHDLTIRELSETIKKISGFEGRIFFNKDRFVGTKRKVLNIDLAKRELGWTVNNKMHTLEEGLTKTIDWYKQNIK